MAAPNAPTDLLTSADERYTITLTWVSPVDGDTATFYSIYYGTEESSVDVLLGTVAHPTVTYDHTPVDDGAIFYYEVFANNGDGQSATGATNSGASWDVPGPPLNITVTATDVGELSLVWDEPAGDGGTEIINYKVYTGTSLAEVEAKETPTATLGTENTDYILAGLDDGYTLYYQVTAENLIGESLRMTTVNATTWDVPEAPTGLDVVGSDGEITVSWGAPSFDGGTELTYYEVYIGTTAEAVQSTDLPVATLGTDVFTHTESGLEDGQRYYCQVKALNSIGGGERTEVKSDMTSGIPGAPINVSSVDGNTVATLSWSAPSDTGGTEITEYHIYQGTALGSLVEIGTTIANRLWFTSTGLTNGTTYYLAVSAENVKGEGAQSLAVSAKPEAVISTEENLLQWVCDSVGMSVFKAYGVASFVAPISDKKKILGIYASFITTDNVTAETNIVVDVGAHTVMVYEGGIRSANLYDLLVMVLYR